MAKKDFFQVKDGKLERTRRHCPKCGPGTFMGQHKDRVSCGKCGYTEFAKRQ
jgi:small subunit ribosomal protein S27Ae